jgi:hypothetical protein
VWRVRTVACVSSTVDLRTWVRTVPIGVVAATATTTTTAATSPPFSAKHVSSLFIAEKVHVGPVDVAQHHRLLGRSDQKKSHPGSSSTILIISAGHVTFCAPLHLGCPTSLGPPPCRVQERVPSLCLDAHALNSAQHFRWPRESVHIWTRPTTSVLEP